MACLEQVRQVVVRHQRARHRHAVDGPVGDRLAPLPWLKDVDGDGDAELIVWSRLPWGDSEVDNALVPVVYALDPVHDRLVRRDDKAKALRVKVADAYHELANRNENPEARACFVAVTAALGG